MARPKNKNISVQVVSRKDREHFYLKWKDPITGKWHERTTGTSKVKEARREAMLLEEEFRTRPSAAGRSMEWSKFVERYREEYGPLLKPRSLSQSMTMLNRISALPAVKTLADITAERLAELARQMRKSGLKPVSIYGSMQTLKAALNWGRLQGLITELPHFPIVATTRDIKEPGGRPLTPAEFDRMLDSIPAVVPPAVVPNFRFLIMGLRYSGLRLTSALLLSWDDPTVHRVDFTGPFPMIRIVKHLSKGRRDEIIPMHPRLSRLLLEVPVDERHGPVFHFPKLRNRRTSVVSHRFWVSKKISAIGKHAKIEVKPGVFASAHDLRRTLSLELSLQYGGDAVASKVLGHVDQQTTKDFYSILAAEQAASIMWGVSVDKMIDLSAETAADLENYKRNKSLPQ